MLKVFEVMSVCINATRSIPEARTLFNTCGLIVVHTANNSLLHIFRYDRYFLIYNILIFAMLQ